MDSAALRLFKIESDINGILPAGGGSLYIYFVSLLSRLCSALEDGDGILRSIALGSFLASCGLSSAKAFEPLVREPVRRFCVLGEVDWSQQDDTGRAFYRNGKRPNVVLRVNPNAWNSESSTSQGEHFECPPCKALCGVQDTIERGWRHLTFFSTAANWLPGCRALGVASTESIWGRFNLAQVPWDPARQRWVGTSYIFGKALAAFNKLSRPTWVYNCDIDAD